MKKYIILIFIFICTIACSKDDSLDPRPLVIPGQFITLNITNARIDSKNLLASGFEGVIDAPSKNVDKYELYVAHRNSFGFVTDFVLLQTITSFPANIKVTSADVQLVGIPALVKSDQLRFFGRSFKDGVVADFNSLSSTLRSSQAQKQGYKFFTDVTDAPSDKLENQYTW